MLTAYYGEQIAMDTLDKAQTNRFHSGTIHARRCRLCLAQHQQYIIRKTLILWDDVRPTEITAHMTRARFTHTFT